MKDYGTEFLAYQPLLKPTGISQGGGFTLQLDIPESEYESIKELLNPALKEYEFIIKIEGRKLT